MPTNPNLTELEKKVMFEKYTEPAFTGKFTDSKLEGAYVCKNCHHLLYYSKDKFNSYCGWPSFDDEAFEAVKKIPDADGSRTEILCNNCNIHLGHVFTGEKFTIKNLRHCVNSASLDFISQENIGSIVVGCGCFWGVQHLFKKLEGVIFTSVGYSGGDTENPTYQEVCNYSTGHYEVLQVLFDKNKTDVEKVLKYFFEIHDFTQKDGQGPDIGQQYESVIFYQSEEEKQIAEQLILALQSKGYDVATEVLPAKTFYPAEDYHQNYYTKTGKSPYCHIYRKIFE